MTIETYQLAHGLNHDLTVLRHIKIEQDKQRCIGFRDSNNESIDTFWCAELRNDFREFIVGEIEKANRIFNEL